MNAPMTPGLRAAIAAGQHLKVKDGTNLDPILRAIEDNNKAVDARLKSIEGSAQKVIEATARLDEMDQKMARRGGVGEASSQPETWGQEFTSAPELKEFAAQTSRPGRLRMEMKTTLTTSPGSAGALVRPTRDDVLMMPRRAVMVRDLLPVIQIFNRVGRIPSSDGASGRSRHCRGRGPQARERDGVRYGHGGIEGYRALDSGLASDPR